MNRQHRILLVADPYVPVPPLYYGGVERIVDFLAEELKNRGWNVTLACHPDSTCAVKQLTLCNRGSHQLRRLSNLVSVAHEILTGGYDLIHSFGHCDLTALFWPTSRLQIQSFQAPLRPASEGRHAQQLLGPIHDKPVGKPAWKHQRWSRCHLETARARHHPPDHALPLVFSS
jgi:hypothetical protein